MKTKKIKFILLLAFVGLTSCASNAQTIILQSEDHKQKIELDLKNIELIKVNGIKTDAVWYVREFDNDKEYGNNLMYSVILNDGLGLNFFVNETGGISALLYQNADDQNPTYFTGGIDDWNNLIPHFYIESVEPTHIGKDGTLDFKIDGKVLKENVPQFDVKFYSNNKEVDLKNSTFTLDTDGYELFSSYYYNAKIKYPTNVAFDYFYIKSGNYNFICSLNSDSIENFKPLLTTATLDSLRGKVKRVTKIFYNVDITPKGEFKKGRAFNGHEVFYDEKGNHVASYPSDANNIFLFDNKGRLVKSFEFLWNLEYMGVVLKKEYTYDKSGVLKTSSKYVDMFPDDKYTTDDYAKMQIIFYKHLEKWKKEILANRNDWNLDEKFEYISNDFGKHIGRRLIEDWNGAVDDSEIYYYEKRGVYITSRIAHYSAAGQMLHPKYTFQCTFDQNGNWTTKIEKGCSDLVYEFYTNAAGLDDDDECYNQFHLIERKIEYYK